MIAAYRVLAPLLRQADAAWEARLAHRTAALHAETEYVHLSFLGYGTTERVRCIGRMLRRPLPPWQAPGHPFGNAKALIARLFAPAAAGLRLRLSCGDQEAEATTDPAGRYEVELPCSPVAGPDGRAQVALRIPGTRGPELTAPVLLPATSAQFGVVSDIDDTVLEANVANQMRYYWDSLTRGPRGRSAVPGMAPLYQALQAGATGEDRNPFFYISGTSWDLCDLLTAALSHYGYPEGHLRLKDVRRGFGPEPRGQQQTYKNRHLRDILDFYPALPFVLIGDTTEADPAIYADLIAERPAQVRAVLLRRAPRLGRTADALERLRAVSEQMEIPLILGTDGGELAQAARALGLTP